MEDLIKALQIFLKYKNEKWPTFCEHDCLYVDVDPEMVSSEDKEELKKLGFECNDESFYSFKYGSC